MFDITAIRPGTDQRLRLRYNPHNSTLVDESGASVVDKLIPKMHHPASITGRDQSAAKTTPRLLKIQLGLSCNYACEYCSQRFVPHAAETNPGDIDAFMAGLDAWVKLPPQKIEFWGGEPLVYIKTLRPLAEALRTKYPQAMMSIITNGSLLTPVINEWLDRMGFGIGLSHDGPGQAVRGPDPLLDPGKRVAILDLYHRLAPQGRISFNAMMNRENTSRAAVQRFFIELTGDTRVKIGEGGIVDAYDEGGVALSLGAQEFSAYRNQAFGEIRAGAVANFDGVRGRISGFLDSLRTGRPSSALGQKCGMDRSDAIAVDLRGNVLTCQNVSAAATAPNGERHRIGQVSDFEAIRLNTASHWSKRADCPSCPVLQICQGSCMFLEGPLWETSCDNAYSDAIPIFAAAIEFLTGFVPIRIDGPQRDDRKDLFGNVRGDDQSARSAARKPFPIKVVTA